MFFVISPLAKAPERASRIYDDRFLFIYFKSCYRFALIPFLLLPSADHLCAVCILWLDDLAVTSFGPFESIFFQLICMKVLYLKTMISCWHHRQASPWSPKITWRSLRQLLLVSFSKEARKEFRVILERLKNAFSIMQQRGDRAMNEPLEARSPLIIDARFMSKRVIFADFVLSAN